MMGRSTASIMGSVGKQLRHFPESETAAAVYRALQLAWQASASSPDMLADFEKIEALRARLLKDTSRVPVPDFGAGPRWKRLLGMPRPEGKVNHRKLGVLCRQSSKPPQWGALLHTLILEVKPRLVLEMGSCLGLSAAYMATALVRNGHGRLYTLEGAPALAGITWQNLQAAGCAHTSEVYRGQFAELLPRLLPAMKQRLGFAFVDGHHDGPATLQYWQMLKSHLAPKAIVVFDDIRWSGGMRKAWRQIAADKDIQLALDLGEMGVVAVG